MCYKWAYHSRWHFLLPIYSKKRNAWWKPLSSPIVLGVNRFKMFLLNRWVFEDIWNFSKSKSLIIDNKCWILWKGMPRETIILPLKTKKFFFSSLLFRANSLKVTSSGKLSLLKFWPVMHKKYYIIWTKYYLNKKSSSSSSSSWAIYKFVLHDTQNMRHAHGLLWVYPLLAKLYT